MKLRLTNQLYGAVAVLALVASAGNALAQGESYIVSGQVVSDTALPADGGYIGDLASASISDSGCSSCQSGTCSGGTCSGGTCSGGDCSGGDCGGGVLGKLRSRCGDADCAVCQDRRYDQSDLFYNYYSGGNCNTSNAQMYISPVPVPHFVGHTFNTYQPLSVQAQRPLPQQLRRRAWNQSDQGALFVSADQAGGEQSVLEQAAFTALMITPV